MDAFVWIGVCNVHGDCALGFTELMADLFCPILRTIVLLDHRRIRAFGVLKGRQIVITRLHSPDLITLRGEGLPAVGFYADICKQGLPVLVNGEASGVVMIVAVIVITSFDSEAVAVVFGNEKPYAGEGDILTVCTVLMKRLELGDFFPCKNLQKAVKQVMLFQKKRIFCDLTVSSRKSHQLLILYPFSK